jgi:hydroxyacylglutathione hydrolase
VTDETVVKTSHGRAPGHPPRIEVAAFGPWETNAYLVWDGRSPDALILDPGMGAAGPLMERVAANGLHLVLVADSHGHIDHVFDNAPLVRASGAPLAIHADDAYRLSGDNVYGFDVERSFPTDKLRDGQQLRVGDMVWDVLHTPGHTEGSVCLYEERRGLLLSGDVIFAGAPGRTDLPGGSGVQMADSLGRLARLIPPSVRVLPGHGPETVIERELSWMRRLAQTPSFSSQ